MNNLLSNTFLKSMYLVSISVLTIYASNTQLTELSPSAEASHSIDNAPQKTQLNASAEEFSPQLHEEFQKIRIDASAEEFYPQLNEEFQQNIQEDIQSKKKIIIEILNCIHNCETSHEYISCQINFHKKSYLFKRFINNSIFFIDTKNNYTPLITLFQENSEIYQKTLQSNPEYKKLSTKIKKHQKLLEQEKNYIESLQKKIKEHEKETKRYKNLLKNRKIHKSLLAKKIKKHQKLLRKEKRHHELLEKEKNYIESLLKEIKECKKLLEQEEIKNNPVYWYIECLWNETIALFTLYTLDENCSWKQIKNMFGKDILNVIPKNHPTLNKQLIAEKLHSI